MSRPGRVLALVVAASLLSIAQELTFKADARLIEVYPTISDSKGHYVDGLTRERFHVLDNGGPQEISAFEGEASRVSCAILIDTTGSMQRTMPFVKNAVVHFLDDLRTDDSVAIYGFTSSVTLLQDFTTDRNAAKRATLRIRASGETALFDAIAKVTHDTGRIKGKKAIIVLTDGADNASTLLVTGAIESAKKAGIPVYTVAQGDALMKNLRLIADNTGGTFHEATSSNKVSDVFKEILSSLAHTYLLAYKPPVAASAAKWRTIQVTVSGLKDYKARCREGYYPE
jgi:Ca-activated chloride channel family protein